jgi:hypothetical protein
MNFRTVLFATVALLGATVYAGSAYALSENDIIRFHEACLHGDRDACTHRDAAIHDHDHEAEWRQHHPEWYR